MEGEILEMGILILDRAKTYFQAWGWIGMLVGLVNMLGSLEDPAAIGPAMAVAILTVFYGVAMAYLFCLPIKTKLQLLPDEDNNVDNKTAIGKDKTKKLGRL